MYSLYLDHLRQDFGDFAHGQRNVILLLVWASGRVRAGAWVRRGGVHVHVASAFAGGSQRGRWPSRTAQDDVSSESGRARGRAHSLRPHSLNLALDDVVEEVDVVEFAKVLQILWRQRRRM